MDGPQDGVFTDGAFALELGGNLPELRLAYRSAGRLAADGRNAVLVTHGYTGSHRMFGAGGMWEALVGPGRAIDTDRCFAISINVPGSCYGSTGPASRDPRSGEVFGPNFPALTLHDMARAQKLLLESLGVRHLAAVAGPSYGAQLAYAWAVHFPAFVGGIAAITGSAAGSGTPATLAELRAHFAAVPGWNDGNYAPDAMRPALTEYRIALLRRYGMPAWLQAKIPDPARQERALAQIAAQWAGEFDVHSLLVLRAASIASDMRAHLPALRLPVFVSLCTSDALFPPERGAKLRAALAGARLTWFDLDSPYGHLASGLDAEKLAGALGSFIGDLVER